MQQFYITAFKYGGLYRNFYDRCCTQYFVENSRPTSAKIKTTDILRCKLWTRSKHIKINDNLRISLNEALFSIKPGDRSLFFIFIRPISWHFCDGIMLWDSCRRRCEYISEAIVLYALMSRTSYGILCSRWSTFWGIKGWKKHTKT